MSKLKKEGNKIVDMKKGSKAKNVEIEIRWVVQGIKAIVRFKIQDYSISFNRPVWTICHSLYFSTD